MSKFSEAAQAAGNLSRQYKSVLDLVAFVQELGDLDQAKGAAENQLKDILNQKLRAEEALSTVNVAVNDANDALRGARVQAEQVTASADSYAMQVRSDAEAQANATNQAVNYVTEQARIREDTLNAKETELVSREAKLDEREAEVERKEAEHKGKAKALHKLMHSGAGAEE